MKLSLRQTNRIGTIFQWLSFFLIGMGMSFSLQAAQSLASSMSLSLGTSSGSLANLTLASEGKIVNLYTNGAGNLNVTFKFPAAGLASEINMSAYLQQKTGSDRITFQALNTSDVWVNLGTSPGGTSYQRIIFTLPSGVVRSGTISIRMLSNPNANDFKLDQMILIDKTGSVLPPPSISNFSASPSSIVTGGSSTLNFSATGATSMTINPGNINVTGLSSLPVYPAVSTNYTLTATNSSGSVSQSAMVSVASVVVAPTILEFIANPSVISVGQKTTLSFSTTGATSMTINPGNINVLGLSSIDLYPNVSTSYTLTATNSLGSISSSLNVTVNPVSTGLTIPAGSKWYWQLQGTINTSVNVKVYDIDFYDTSASMIASLKAAGHTVICYYSAGTYEDWRSDANQFPTSALGTNVDGWAGEKWLDVRNTEVRTIMSKRMDLAKSKGCDGLEPDNVDGYDQNTGFPLTKADQINYNKFLADQAHARGMIVALKNSPDLVSSLVNYFDFSVAEECVRYNECASYTPFITQNKAVLNAEYVNWRPYSDATCAQTAKLKLSTVFYNLALDGNVYQPCP